MNKVTLLGRLTADPELKVAQGNKGDFTIVNFSLAVNDKNNRERVDFFRCVAFNKLGEIIDEYFNKGSRILINGSLKTETYEKDGKNNTIIKVVVDEFHFIDNKYDNVNTNAQTNTKTDNEQVEQKQSPRENTKKFAVNEEDIPF